jgi:replicative DNA helicase
MSQATLLSKALSVRVDNLKADLARVSRGERVLTHVPTGLPTFDGKFGGLEIGILTLVLGLFGDGKTAFLGHLAKASAEAGVGVLLVLLEDPQEKLADRYLAGVMGESANAIARLQIDNPDRLDAALRESEWAARVALVTGQMGVPDCLELVGRAVERGIGGCPLGLVVVDYAQSFGVEEGGMEQACASLAWGLNALAGKHRLAITLGSQVATDVLRRGRQRWESSLRGGGEGDETGFKPGKGDAMWSRRLEQYARAVYYLFRPGRWRRECGDLSARDDRVVIQVGKANYGPEGEETFRWDGRTCTISERIT